MIERVANAVGIIGVGHLAGYLVEGLRRADSRQAPHWRGGPVTTGPRDSPRASRGIHIILSPRNAERAADLAARFGATVAADNQAVADAADLIILSTRPGDAVAAVTGVTFRPTQTVVSVAAGLPLETLKAAAAPATAIRALPISCAAINRSPTLLYPDHPQARALFALLGQVYVLPDESCFTPASAISAFYGWIYALLDETITWAVQAGVPPPIARSLVLETVQGAADMALAQPDQGLSSILGTLATPGGITEQGLRVLCERQGLAAWTEALEAVLSHLQSCMNGISEPLAAA